MTQDTAKTTWCAATQGRIYFLRGLWGYGIWSNIDFKGARQQGAKVERRQRHDYEEVAIDFSGRRDYPCQLFVMKSPVYFDSNEIAVRVYEPAWADELGSQMKDGIFDRCEVESEYWGTAAEWEKAFEGYTEGNAERLEHSLSLWPSKPEAKRVIEEFKISYVCREKQLLEALRLDAPAVQNRDFDAYAGVGDWNRAPKGWEEHVGWNEAPRKTEYTFDIPSADGTVPRRVTVSWTSASAYEDFSSAVKVAIAAPSTASAIRELRTQLTDGLFKDLDVKVLYKGREIKEFCDLPTADIAKAMCQHREAEEQDIRELAEMAEELFLG